MRFKTLLLLMLLAGVLSANTIVFSNTENAENTAFEANTSSSVVNAYFDDDFDIGEPEDLWDCNDPSITDDPSINQAEIDLTQNDENVLGDQDPDSYTVEYFESEEDMESDNPISTPENYINIDNPQTIYVRVSLDNNLYCFAEGDFEIGAADVPNLPYSDLEPLQLCNNSPEEPFTYNLKENTVRILDGQDPTEFAVGYYNTQQDAEDDTNAIVDLAAIDYEPTEGEIIWVRIYNMEHPQCFVVTSFEIEEITEIHIGEVDDITVCGDGNAIGTSFDLTQNDDAALDGQTPDDYEVVY